MNPYKYLIWQYSSKNGNWYDATEYITWIQYVNNSWAVKYKDKDSIIHVSNRNLFYCDRCEEREFIQIEHEGIRQYHVKKLITFFDGFGNSLTKLFFDNGYTKVDYTTSFKIYKNTLKDPKVKGIFNYYKQVVQLIAKDEEDAYMLAQFDKIMVINEESVLAAYLNRSNESIQSFKVGPIIAPFGINASQLSAIKTALSNKISIIEGPPGTGKTQTILNFIANALIRKKKVAVVSNNNSAFENVYEKLEKYNFSFFAAKLGKRDNVDSFFETIDLSVPELTSSGKPADYMIKDYNTKLGRLFNKENRKNKLVEEREAIALEFEHFKSDNDINDIKPKNRYPSSKDILDVKVFLDERQKDKVSFFKRYLIRTKLKLDKHFFKLDNVEQNNILNTLYFQSKLSEVDGEIEIINEELEKETFGDAVKTFTRLSMEYFKSDLVDYFKDKRKTLQKQNTYKLNFSEFSDDFPVILSSTYALAQCTKDGFLYDYLIVDESSQVNMASAILSMRMAKNIIVVGDIKQLPQVEDRDFEKTNNKLLEAFKVDKAFSYYGHSILSSVLAVFGDKVPRTLLKEHYRCSPEIIGFCNKEFYDNQLVVYTKNKVDKPLRLIKLVEGNHARKNPTGKGGLYSEREADEIKKFIDETKPDDLGIITPYRCQVSAIKNKLNDDSIDVDTIHKFQGREKKNIILSTVINEPNEFVDDPNMVNVAVSRAVDSFTIVVSDKVVNSKQGVLSDLVNYIKYHTDFASFEEGKIHSIYDLLYSDYEVQLNKFREKYPSKDFDTENITKVVIKNILKEYSGLKLAMHVPLRQLIKLNGINLTDEETRFYFNRNSHVDFVIYNSLSNVPLLAIEVDGIAFHEQSEEQKIRDKKKDSILSKAGLKLLRLKTNETGERDKIRTALNESLS